MSYFPERNRSGFLSKADAQSGYQFHDAGDWQATATNGAATANITIGNNLNKNAKFWSFADGSADKCIISGSNGPFQPLPVGCIHQAKIRIRWGVRTGTTGSRKCRWRVRALQSQTADAIISTADAEIRDHANGVSATEPDADNKTTVDEVVIELSDNGWTQAPTAFVIIREPSHADDNIGNAVILYNAVVLVR